MKCSPGARVPSSWAPNIMDMYGFMVVVVKDEIVLLMFF